MKTRIVCALLLALMLLALAGCGKKEDHPQPEDPNVTQKEEAVPVHLVCSNGSITLRFSLEEGHWLWADDQDLPPRRELCPGHAGDGAGHRESAACHHRRPAGGLWAGQPHQIRHRHRQPGRIRHLPPGQGVRRQRVCIPGGGEATVYAVPDLMSQIGRSIYDMMALPELPQLTAENVTSLTVTAGERTLTLTPAEGAWTADGRDVTDQLADLTAWLGDMHLAACVDWRPSAGAAALCGLDKPAVTLTAAYTHAGADRSLTLTVGGQRGAGYCVTVSDDDTVYLMSAEALAPLLTLAQSGLE